MQPGHHGADRRVHDLGDLLVAEPSRRPAGRASGSSRTGTPRRLHGFDRDLSSTRSRPSLDAAATQPVVQVPLVHVLGTIHGLGLALLLAVRVDEAVREDPVEPRLEVGALLEPGEPPDRPAGRCPAPDPRRRWGCGSSAWPPRTGSGAAAARPARIARAAAVVRFSCGLSHPKPPTARPATNLRPTSTAHFARSDGKMEARCPTTTPPKRPAAQRPEAGRRRAPHDPWIAIAPRSGSARVQSVRLDFGQHEISYSQFEERSMTTRSTRTPGQDLGHVRLGAIIQDDGAQKAFTTKLPRTSRSTRPTRHGCGRTSRVRVRHAEPVLGLLCSSCRVLLMGLALLVPVPTDGRSGANAAQHGQEQGQDLRPQGDEDHLRRCRRRRRGEGRAPRDRRLPEEPEEVPAAGRAHPQGRAAARSPGVRQDAARPGRRR